MAGRSCFFTCACSKAKGRLHTAERHLSDAIRQNPHELPIRIEHGNVLLLQARYKEAAEEAEFVLERSPGHPGAESILRAGLGQQVSE